MTSQDSQRTSLPVCSNRFPISCPSAERSTAIIRDGARQLALITIVDIAVFFAVLLVGFAYVWKRGDLNWVRAYRRGDINDEPPPGGSPEVDLEQALSV